MLEPREVARKPLTVERFGERLVFWRDSSGTLTAQRDRCPHLGASLGAGQVIEDPIVCPLHGFRFGEDEQCRHAPALGRQGHIPSGLAV